MYYKLLLKQQNRAYCKLYNKVQNANKTKTSLPLWWEHNNSHFQGL
jgi:hypothetical protein